MLEGGDGDDHLSGGPGADTLTGADGSDRLDGGEGDDRLDGGAGGDDLVGGAGVDTLTYELAAAAVTVTLDDRPDDGESGEGDDAHADVERVIGSPGDDRPSAGAGAVTLEGGDGFDRLVGGPGADVLRGGEGDDTLDGAGGADVLDGGGPQDPGGSGVGRYEYRLDDGPWRDLGAARRVVLPSYRAGAAPRTLRVRAIDRAGNVGRTSPAAAVPLSAHAALSKDQIVERIIREQGLDRLRQYVSLKGVTLATELAEAAAFAAGMRVIVDVTSKATIVVAIVDFLAFGVEDTGCDLVSWDNNARDRLFLPAGRELAAVARASLAAHPLLTERASALIAQLTRFRDDTNELLKQVPKQCKPDREAAVDSAPS